MKKIMECIDRVSKLGEVPVLGFAALKDVKSVVQLDIPTIDERRKQVEKNTKKISEEYYQTMLDRIHLKINTAFNDASYLTKHYIKISASITYPNSCHLAPSVIPRVRETIESELAALGYTDCETNYDPKTGEVSFIIKY